jgi:hypothetical protein
MNLINILENLGKKNTKDPKYLLIILLNALGKTDVVIATGMKKELEAAKKRGEQIGEKSFSKDTIRGYLNIAWNKIEPQIIPNLGMNSNESIDSDRMNMSSPQNEGNKGKSEEIRPKVIALFEEYNTLKDVLNPIKSNSNLNNQFSQYCFEQLNNIANLDTFDNNPDNNTAILKKLYSIAGQTYLNQIVSNQSKANNMISIPADRKFALNLFDKGRELGEIDVIIYRIQLSESVQNAVINNENILEFIEAIFTESRIIPWLIRASFKPLFFEYFVEYDYDEQKNMSTQEKYLKFEELYLY